MRVAVLGASGRTGRLLATGLLRHGHRVAVLARDPAALGDLALEVEVVPGDARNPDARAALLVGADAVMSTLGPTAKDATLHRDVAAGLVAAMPAAGVRRFIGISGAGIDVPGDDKSPRDQLISSLIRRLGGAVVADKPAEYEVFAASDLDWTLVRPPRLKDGPATGFVEHHAHRSTRSTTITRADLAAFLVDVLENERYVRQAPFVAGASRPGRARNTIGVEPSQSDDAN